MYVFQFIRTWRDPFRHLILIAIPLLLISFFDYIFSGTGFARSINSGPLPFTTVLTIGFALMFQIHGSSLSFESIAEDFFTVKRDRLLSSPADPRSIVVSTMTMAAATSFLQTLVVVLCAVFILGTPMTSFAAVLLLLTLSVVLNQLLGTVILLLSGSIKTADIIVSVYGSIAPMTIGLYFPLPDHPLVDFMRHYLTPMALTNTAILGFMEQDWSKALTGSVGMIVFTVLLCIVLTIKVRRVTE